MLLNRDRAPQRALLSSQSNRISSLLLQPSKGLAIETLGSLRKLTGIVFVTLGIGAATPSGWAQGYRPTSQDLVDQTIHDVIVRIPHAAGEDVMGNTGIYPVQRGYDLKQRHDAVYGGASAEVHRELQKLTAEHHRNNVKLKMELERKLDDVEAEFRRVAAKARKPDMIAEIRAKLRKEAGEAYAKFEEKIAEEKARFDEKRSEILAKRHGG